jgi:hypothetical protein
MRETPEVLRKEAEKKRLEVILAEVELAITLQRLSLSEHSLGELDSSNISHRNAVASIGRARYLFSQTPTDGEAMWHTLDKKIQELEGLLQHRPG